LYAILVANSVLAENEYFRKHTNHIQNSERARARLEGQRAREGRARREASLAHSPCFLGAQKSGSPPKAERKLPEPRIRIFSHSETPARVRETRLRVLFLCSFCPRSEQEENGFLEFFRHIFQKSDLSLSRILKDPLVHIFNLKSANPLHAFPLTTTTASQNDDKDEGLEMT